MSGRGFLWSWLMRRHRQDRGLPTSTRSNGWPGGSTGPAAKQTFEAEEIERILTLALRKRNGVRFVIALALGLCQGEALGLKWSRLHKPSKTLEIMKGLQRQTWQHGCGDPHACGARYHKIKSCPKDCKRHQRKCPPPARRTARLPEVTPS